MQHFHMLGGAINIQLLISLPPAPSSLRRQVQVRLRRLRRPRHQYVGTWHTCCMQHPHEGRSANAGAQRLLEPPAGCSLPCSPGRRLAPRPSRRRRWLSKCGWSTAPTPPLDEWKFCTTEIVSYSLAKLCRWSRQLATFSWLQCDDPQFALPPHLLMPSPAFPFCLCRGYHLRQ